MPPNIFSLLMRMDPQSFLGLAPRYQQREPFLGPSDQADMNTQMLTQWAAGKLPFDPNNPIFQQMFMDDTSRERMEFDQSLIGRNYNPHTGSYGR